MAALTTLSNIQAIARGEDKILALVDTDLLVTLVLEAVDREVPASIWRGYTEVAQRYLAAHFLSQALNDPGGRGPVSAETIGGVSQSWTLPYLNLHTVLGATQYGMQFLEYRNKVVVSAAFVNP